VLTKVLDVNSI